MSIQEWWTAKVNTATSSIKQASDSVQGSEGERLIEEEYNDADRLQPTDRDHGEPSRFALADVSRGNTIEVDVDNEKAMSPAPSVDVNNPCADATRDFQTYLEGDYDSGSGNSTDMSGDGEVGMSPPSTSSRLIPRGENETAQTSSHRQELHQSNSEIHPVFYKEPTDDLKDIYSNMGEHEESRRVTFLSGTMGLTVDTTDLIRPHPSDGFHWKQHDHHLQQQTHDDHEEWPASPCSGVILETSPRYGNLQAFRKEMSSRGINAQVKKVTRKYFVLRTEFLLLDTIRPRFVLLLVPSILAKTCDRCFHVSGEPCARQHNRNTWVGKIREHNASRVPRS